jgi:hypothetical protein
MTIARLQIVYLAEAEIQGSRVLPLTVCNAVLPESVLSLSYGTVGCHAGRLPFAEVLLYIIQWQLSWASAAITTHASLFTCTLHRALHHGC